MLLLKNARVITMEKKKTFEKGWILIDGGKIADLGDDEPPQCANTVDLEGKTVLPGFVDAHCHLGMWEDSMGFEGDDGNEATDPVTPHLRSIDAINPADRYFADALAAGVTSVLTGPGSANPIGGQLTAMKTYGRRVDDMVILAPAAMKFALGENPKTVYNKQKRLPMTRMGTAAIIREYLYKAVEYDRKKKLSEMDVDGRPPEFDLRMEALIQVVEGRLPAHFHAHRADDIFTAMRIAEEFSLEIVIVHGTEGYLIADYLADRKIPVITGPMMTDRSKPELKNLSFVNPKGLSEAGVLTAICTDHPAVPLDYLSLNAALAAKNGMDGYAALEAITINPAKILGLDDRIGSLAPGKDADLVILDRHPFELSAAVEAVYVNGKPAFTKQ